MAVDRYLVTMARPRQVRCMKIMNLNCPFSIGIRWRAIQYLVTMARPRQVRSRNYELNVIHFHWDPMEGTEVLVTMAKPWQQVSEILFNKDLEPLNTTAGNQYLVIAG